MSLLAVNCFFFTFMGWPTRHQRHQSGFLSLWLTSFCFRGTCYKNQTLMCVFRKRRGKKTKKHNRFHLQPRLLHTMWSATAHKQADGCHRNVYKSRPEECKQTWVQLLSDKRVNFRQSCCGLPVWSFNYNTAHWRMIVSGFFTPCITQQLK